MASKASSGYVSSEAQVEVSDAGLASDATTLGPEGGNVSFLRQVTIERERQESV